MSGLEAPVELGKQLPKESRDVIAGIRPEDIRITQPGETDRGTEYSFRATVERIEWLGADLLVHFGIESSCPDRIEGLTQEVEIKTTGNGHLLFIARTTPARSIETGQALKLCVDSRKLHLFDHSTGKSLLSRV